MNAGTSSCSRLKRRRRHSTRPSTGSGWDGAVRTAHGSQMFANQQCIAGGQDTFRVNTGVWRKCLNTEPLLSHDFRERALSCDDQQEIQADRNSRNSSGYNNGHNEEDGGSLVSTADGLPSPGLSWAVAHGP
ncbi:hypothetical protein RRG08_013069 [Elysia crispata]|uniref:Uncharacterized protein n=1 Tax=Elysia crispata TaxID=231223 RepID=A0AAE1DPZ1_9GAST|nr:hypothetical protein RRG08_013069 [Elysia crispata]